MAKDSAKEPEVSVLVPIYNVERYLRTCLESLRMQTFKDFEVICINDGSTDGSRAIIQEFLDVDPRFRVIDKDNSGYGASMNRGLREARGRYVAILESDDFFELDALARLHEASVAAKADVVKANFWLYWSCPEERRELFRAVDAREAAGIFAPLDDVALFFRKPSIWSALYGRSFLERNGIWFLETPGASYQDAGFNFKVWACARRVACLETPVLCYRQDNEASSVNSPSKVFCVCDEYESMDKFLDGLDLSAGDLRKLRGILTRMKLDSYLWNYDRLSDELRPQFVDRVSEEFSRDLSRGFDWTFFEPGARADFEAIARRPDAFLRSRNAGGSIGRLLTLGGPALLARTAFFKLFGSSARRTNEKGAAA